jgi:hypothetical protein
MIFQRFLTVLRQTKDYFKASLPTPPDKSVKIVILLEILFEVFKSKVLYWLRFIWFYTLFILAIPLAPFVFMWVVFMTSKEDYDDIKRYRKELNKLKALKDSNKDRIQKEQ